ncbi:hypothetical protein [Streptomyces sp. NPDC060027]|uniref:hypothetical protein n=1 Tax=Streptomyces sp. NPDC060027 TaxID=3347040 RepID=UPI0036C24508
MGERGHNQHPWRERPVGRRAVMAPLAGVVGLAVLGTVFVFLPGVVVDHDLAGAAVAPQERLKAVNDVRAACAVGQTPPEGRREGRTEA